MPVQLDPRAWMIILLLVIEIGITIARHKADRRSVAWYLPQFEAFLLAGIASVPSVARTDLPWAYGCAGLVLYSGGFLLRHLGWVQALLWARRYPKTGRPPFFLRLRPAIRLVGSRHPEPVGLVLQGAGLALLASRWDALLLVVTILVAVGVFDVTGADSRRYPPDEHELHDREGARLLPAWQPIVFAVVLAIGALDLAAIVSHERVIFYGDSQAAGQMLGTLAQVVGTIGVLAISLSFVIAQVAASEVSPRSALALARHPYFLVTATMLLLSLGLDFVLLGRTGELPNVYPVNWWRADIALLIAGVAVGFTGWFTLQAPWLLHPERIVGLELRRFDPIWARQVRDEWGGWVIPRTLWTYRDPLVVIERILYQAVERRDGLTLRTTLSQVAQRIDRHFVRDQDKYDVGEGGAIQNFQRGARAKEVALDAYLVERFGDAIDLAAERRYSFALNQLIEFAEHVGSDRPSDRLRELKRDQFHFLETPETPGEMFIRRILAKSIEFKNAEATGRALQEISRSCKSLLPALPRGEDLYYIYRYAQPDALHPRDYSAESENEEDRRRRSDNDQLIHTFHRHYTEFFRRVAIDAIDGQLWWVLSQGITELLWIARSVFEETNDRPLRRDILRNVLFNLDDVSERLCRVPDDQKRTIIEESPFSLHWLKEPAELLNAESDADLANDLAFYLEGILRSQFANRILSASLVREAADIVSTFTGKYAEPQIRLIDVFADLAREIARGGWTRAEHHRAHLYAALIDGIRHQRLPNTDLWRQDPVKIVIEKVDATLDALGEPRWGHWTDPVPPERAPAVTVEHSAEIVNRPDRETAPGRWQKRTRAQASEKSQD